MEEVEEIFLVYGVSASRKVKSERSELKVYIRQVSSCISLNLIALVSWPRLG